MSNRRVVGSFICFTFAARARELSCALCCNESPEFAHRAATMLEICFGAVCAPRAEARLRTGLQGIMAWAQKISQYLERVFGPFASHSAVHVVVMNSSSGYQKWFQFWPHSAAHWVVMSSCFGYQKWFPFWGHVLVPFARILCFQITMDEGTSSGSCFRYQK